MSGNAHLASSSILFWLTLLVAGGIIFIGARFVLSPVRAAKDFGVPAVENSGSAYLWAKGTRDIVSGLLTVGLLWSKADPQVIAVFIAIAALIPLGDLLNVFAHIRKSNMLALVIHGGTALFMWRLAFFLYRG